MTRRMKRDEEQMMCVAIKCRTLDIATSSHRCNTKNDLNKAVLNYEQTCNIPKNIVVSTIIST